jgi:hypothetical protein
MAPEFFPFVAFVALAILVFLGFIGGTSFSIVAFTPKRNRRSWRRIAIGTLSGTFVAAVMLFFLGGVIRQQYFLNEPFVAACAGGDMEQVQKLLASGASPNAYGVDHIETALIAATENGNVEIVELLLFRGADPKLQDIRGKTALQHAQESGRKEIAALLEKE